MGLFFVVQLRDGFGTYYFDRRGELIGSDRNKASLFTDQVDAQRVVESMNNHEQPMYHGAEVVEVRG